MKKLLLFVMASSFFLLSFWVFVPSVSAQQCASTRVVNQYACVNNDQCQTEELRCSINGRSCGGDLDDPCLSDEGTCRSFCTSIGGGPECKTTAQAVTCNTSSCQASVLLKNCSTSGGGVSGACNEIGNIQTFQCYVNDGGDTGGGGTSGGTTGSCAWCSTSSQCSASGGSWGGGEGYCAGTDRCCEVPSSGGSSGGGDGLPPCPDCSNRFCGQDGCSSNRHERPGSVPVWQTANQGTIVIPANDTQVSLIWSDPSGLDSCWQNREGNFDLRVYEISEFGGTIRQTIVDSRFSRSSLYIEDTENSDRENGQMRYRFYPTGRYYRALVRSVNTICSSNNPALSDWATIEFQVYATQTGKIFLDTNDDAVVDANGKCVSPTVPGGDTTLSLISQRTQPQWSEYNFGGWGYVTISGNENDATLPSRGLGTPWADDAMAGSAASIVDDNWSTFWASNSRSRYHNGELDDNVRGEGVGYNFTPPYQSIQYMRFYGYSSGDPDYRVSDVPHLNVSIQDEAGQNVSLVNGPVSRSWFVTPATLISQVRFTAHVTGWTDSRHMGVAEIELFTNPDPTPQFNTVAMGTEQIDTAGWTNEGAFSINSAMGVASTLELDLSSDEFTCSCPEGCVYNVSQANQNMNFFVNVKADPWFQIQDGAVAAYGDGSLAISNPIPEQCTSANNCTPVMVRTPNSTAPAVITGGGTVDMSETPGLQTTGIDDENQNWLARLTATPARQDFAYFRRIYKFPTAEVQDDYELNFNNASKPDGTPDNLGVSAYYREGDLTITSPWTVASGESYVILVNGDVNVNANITVANGGFLAFVASGDITFASTLGSSTVNSTTPVVEGVYIADGKIVLPASQLKFVGAGTFVGWNGFDLFRNFDSTDNWYNPTELFVYRPDLLRNAPEEMKTPRYEWNEVNP